MLIGRLTLYNSLKLDVIYKIQYRVGLSWATLILLLYAPSPVTSDPEILEKASGSWSSEYGPA